MVAIFRIISEYERALTRVKYPLNILQTYWKYTSKVYLKYTSSYLQYTPNILQPAELQKKKYTTSDLNRIL